MDIDMDSGLPVEFIVSLARYFGEEDSGAEDAKWGAAEGSDYDISEVEYSDEGGRPIVPRKRRPAPREPPQSVKLRTIIR